MGYGVRAEVEVVVVVERLLHIDGQGSGLADCCAVARQHTASVLVIDVYPHVVLSHEHLLQVLCLPEIALAAALVFLRYTADVKLADGLYLAKLRLLVDRRAQAHHHRTDEQQHEDNDYQRKPEQLVV